MPIRKIDKVTFFGLFTGQEWALYFAAVDANNTAIRALNFLLTLAPWEMETNHPMIVSGLQTLQTENIITGERAAEIAESL